MLVSDDPGISVEGARELRTIAVKNRSEIDSKCVLCSTFIRDFLSAETIKIFNVD
jgi:hypothetical protein